IGLELHSTGSVDGGPAAMKLASVATAKSYAVTLSGDSGTSALQINVTQAADTTGIAAPLIQLGAVPPDITGNVFSLSDPTYASGCPHKNGGPDSMPGMAADATKAFDIQFQIHGGEVDADYNFCVKSLKANP